jgi:hypothetical protein
LTGHPEATPTALLHDIKHNKVLQAHDIVLKVITEDAPRVAPGAAGAVPCHTPTPHGRAFTRQFISRSPSRNDGCAGEACAR